MAIPTALRAGRCGPRPPSDPHRARAWAALPGGLFLLLCTSTGCAPGGAAIATVENRCSLRLDGRDDFVDLGQIGAGHPLLLAGSRLTVSAWFRQEPGGDPYQRIVDKSDGVLARNGWALAADPGERRIHFYLHDSRKGGDFVGPAGAFRPGQWHQVTTVARADRLEIYVDGRRERAAGYESGSFALPATVATGARLGNWNHEPGRAFRGWIDEVAVWKTDLPAAAIGAFHAARGRADLRRNWGPYTAAESLAAWWRMESGEGGVASGSVADSASGVASGRLMPDAAGANAPLLDCANVP